MEVYVWSGDWGLPSIEFNCLQLMTLIKISGVQAEIKKVNNPFGSPTGNFPVFKHCKRKLTKFQDVLTYLKDRNYCPDLNLTSKQLAESFAYRNMIEEKLYTALRYIWWIDKKNYIEMTRPWYSKVIPFPFNYYYPGHIRRENENIISSLYSDMEEANIQVEVYKEAEKCLTCLSNRLGDADFFYGNNPTSLDAIVYGCLAPLLKAPFPSNVLQNHLKASPNLIKFIMGITRRYFLRELQEYEKYNQQTEKNSAKLDIFPNKIRNQIFAGIFATAAMLSYGILSGIFSLSITSVGVGDITEYDEDTEYDNEDSSD
ncbi:hypothetical protein PGB90_006354 [Kerria lacca]